MQCSVKYVKFFIGFLGHVLFICDAYLSDVTFDLFGNSGIGVIAAFGNFNADKLTDIFIFNDNGKHNTLHKS